MVRGDVICLWGLHAHRAIGQGTMALINVDHPIRKREVRRIQEQHSPRHPKLGATKLYTPRYVERVLTSHIKKTKLGNKLWTKYCSMLTVR